METPKKLNTKVCQMFNLKYPIIGAPMFLVSNEDMVCAATNAGGLGTFPALNFRPIENYRRAIKEIKSKTTGAFGINIIVQQANKLQEQQIDIALEEEVPLIITSLGSPKSLLQKTKNTKTKVFCDVIGLTHAQKVADLGADGLIAVGSGAGGHAGETSLFALIPYLKKHLDLPIVAAGSMTDGRSLLAALALGADAIYMGTRIIASKEAQVDKEYKQAIINANCEDIINTDRVDGFPGNFINSEKLQSLLKPNLVDNLLSQNAKVKRWVSLLRASRILFGPSQQKVSYKNVYSAGHGVALIDSVEDIKTIIETTMSDYYKTLDNINHIK